MGRAYVYVIVGGGVSAGYAANEFVKRRVAHGELCIISEEPVAPYERPALSKGYLLPEAPARLPSFHCCVGTNDEKLLLKWYKALKIEEFGVSGSDAANVCYLRDLADADRLVDVMQSSGSGNAVVIGGGYIGMECAASLVINNLNVTMVFPEAHCTRIVIQFTMKISTSQKE